MNSLGITTYTGFMALPDNETKKQILLEELKDNTALEISKAWECKVYNIYDRMRSFGIASQRNSGNPATRAPRKSAGTTTPAPKIEREIKKMAIPEVNSFTVKLVLTAKGEELTDRLMRLIEILNKDSVYNLTFDIKEIRRTEPQDDAPPEEYEPGAEG